MRRPVATSGMELELRLTLPEPGCEDEEGSELFREARYQDYLQHQQVQVTMLEWQGDSGSEHQVEELQEKIGRMLASASPALVTRVQRIGVAALQIFLSINWLGDQLEVELAKLLPFISSIEISSFVEHLLVGDGEGVVSNVRFPILLVFAKTILVCQRSHFSHMANHRFWSLRCCSLEARVLEERSDLLHQEAQALVEEGISMSWNEEKKLHSLFLLEAAAHQVHYYKVKEAEQLVKEAADLAGFNLAESGALGKRTKYQERDVAQFTIELNLKVEDNNMEEVDRALLVRDVRLDDDLRLDKIAFKEDRPDRTSSLDVLQQAVLASMFGLKLRSLPTMDALTQEEVVPYLAPLLEHPRAWALHASALLARSQMETNAGRTVERALAQVESVVESLRLPHCFQTGRLAFVHVSHLPPVWEVERALGKMMVALGQVKSALDIYLRLELWEEVIACYTHLQLRHKAAETIQARLAEKETPRLWCLLGDATDDLDCYYKALELSKDKSARAYRSIGFHYYAHKDYATCVQFFEKSLDRSSFQPITVLRLAYAAMELENWELGAKSYRSYCAMEQDSFEAWNNLARCYVNLKQKERAWKVLQEAVRCDFENWKIWDNMMVIAVDIGVFDDTIRAYNRIMDLKKTHVDKDVLEILVKAVTDDVEDCSGNPSSKLRPQLQKLLARITVASPREPAPWHLYGDLLSVSGQEEEVRAAQCYQKSVAAVTGHRGWEKVSDSCKEVLACSTDWLNLLQRVKGAEELQLLNSARLSVSNVMKAVENAQAQVETGKLSEEMEGLVAPVREALNLLMDRVTQLKS